MQARLIGTRQECAAAVAALRRGGFQVRDESAFRLNRGNRVQGRMYVQVELDPPCEHGAERRRVGDV
jgi:hypothetical protein